MIPYWIFTLLAVLLLALLVFSLYRRLSRVQKSLEQAQSRIHSQQVSINGLTAGAVGVDSRLRGLENREKALEHRQESIESQQALGDAPYGEAIRLVQQGADNERLISELGLSENEANLISMIHGGSNN